MRESTSRKRRELFYCSRCQRGIVCVPKIQIFRKCIATAEGREVRGWGKENSERNEDALVTAGGSSSERYETTM